MLPACAPILLVGAAMISGPPAPAPPTARVEHCAGANYVDDLQPNSPEQWGLGEIHEISWLIGEGCGPLTYDVELSRNDGEFEYLGTTGPHEYYGRVEFSWQASGAVGDHVVFRVHRVVPDRDLPYSETALIELSTTVTVRASSWSAIKGRYLHVP